MIKLAVTGLRSRIVQELIPLVGLAAGELERIPVSDTLGRGSIMPIAERYVLAAGVLVGKRVEEQTTREIEQALAVNLVGVIQLVELIFQVHPTARVCVLGSQSGLHGSFDPIYAASKAAVHFYCTQKRVPPGGQLVCLVPPIISDSAMTQRRHDYPMVLELRETVTAIDCARAIKQMLWIDPPSSCLAIIKGKTAAERRGVPQSWDVH